MDDHEKFRRCHEVTAKWEGGWSDHPADSGGKTMFGITERVYHDWLKTKGLDPKPVRNITRAEAEEIFYNNYWLLSGSPTLWPGVDLATYDASVNSGVSRARKWLLASCGGPHHITVKRICCKRMSFLRCLGSWATFGRGWTRRVCDIEAKGVAWAIAATAASNETIKKHLQEEAKHAKRRANREAVGGATTAAGGGAGVSVIDHGGDVVVTPPHDPIPYDPGVTSHGGQLMDQIMSWLPTTIIIMVVVIMLWLIGRSLINRRRAEAFEQEADTVP